MIYYYLAAYDNSKPTAHNLKPVVRTVLVESKVRDKVNALINAAAENNIKDDIKKQREEDLQLLANRYNKQKGISNQIPPPPPPPPPPSQSSVSTANISSKRRSRKRSRIPFNNMLF